MERGFSRRHDGFDYTVSGFNIHEIDLPLLLPLYDTIQLYAYPRGSFQQDSLRCIPGLSLMDVPHIAIKYAKSLLPANQSFNIFLP